MNDFHHAKIATSGSHIGSSDKTGLHIVVK